MSLMKNIFGKKDQPITSYEEFWKWFEINEKKFYKIVQEAENVESQFFEVLTEKLQELREGFFFLTGMSDATHAEIIFTADGNVKNIVFVEELVSAAPKIENWIFSAFKPALDINNIGVRMDDYKFDKNNISFYAIDHKYHPDEVDIVAVYHEYKAEDHDLIATGISIFLDNYLGELEYISNIDNLSVSSLEDATEELIPISKLKDFLIWREKEFVEKYEGFRYDSDSDNFQNLSAELENGKKLLAIVDASLLEWDAKASHPWILSIQIPYVGEPETGLPDDATYLYLNDIEDAILSQLKDTDGYLNVARQTADDSREIYFACREFRKPSKVLDQIIKKYSDRTDIDFEIFKDKYWRTFERFHIG